jgi:NTP pyrophosphatase (non-canonical NTP hydrolase)
MPEWQKMFYDIYPRNTTTSQLLNVARLFEEVGELAESVSAFVGSASFKRAQEYFINEASDVFAWLMGIANQIDAESNLMPEQFGLSLELAMMEQYLNVCSQCGGSVCRCIPIPSSTLGRIARSVPIDQIFPESDSLFSAEQSLETILQEAAATLRIGKNTLMVDINELENLAVDARRLLQFIADQPTETRALLNLTKAIGDIGIDAMMGKISQSTFEDVQRNMEDLPGQQRDQMLEETRRRVSPVWSAMAEAVQAHVDREQSNSG